MDCISPPLICHCEARKPNCCKQSVEILWGFFKKYVKCGSKLPPLTNIILPSVFRRVPQSGHFAPIVPAFLKEARKNWAAWLQAALVTKALKVLMVTLALTQNILAPTPGSGMISDSSRQPIWNTLESEHQTKHLPSSVSVSGCPLPAKEKKEIAKSEKEDKHKTRKKLDHCSDPSMSPLKKLQPSDLARSTQIPGLPLLDSPICCLSSPILKSPPDWLLAFSESEPDDIGLAKQSHKSLVGLHSVHTISLDPGDEELAQHHLFWDRSSSLQGRHRDDNYEFFQPPPPPPPPHGILDINPFMYIFSSIHICRPITWLGNYCRTSISQSAYSHSSNSWLTVLPTIFS